GTNFGFDGREDDKYTLFIKYGDADYFQTYGLQLVAGKGYEQSDTAREYVINETLAHKLGYKNPNDLIGKTIRMGRRPWKPIAGVVKDFKTNSLREETKPLVIGASKRFYSTTAIKMRSSNPKAMQGEIQKLWDKHYPEYVNNITFMDESINRFYQQEEQLSLLYKVFAGLALLISCLGLYGLVSFMAVQKTKEVGIRKVLGASVGSIVLLFSKEFTILIGVAFLIAAPVSYYLMNDWLNDFVEKIPIGVGIFLLAIAVSIIVAWITVGYKAVQAAVVNPVKSLKSE
ncbi:MAG: ABC transporter permease, partial [Gemmatimonadaceae bacterium]|nr:ABC transporter permease [Chitinophagaceae bacterium]